MTNTADTKRGRKPVVGLYSIGLKAYWAQFPGLRERLLEYGRHIENIIAETSEVINFGLVDTEYEAKKAGEYFSSRNVDIVFCHMATYATSSCVLPVHQICRAPAVFLSLQPSVHLNYKKTDTGEWLANCGACVAPEISNALHRAGIKYRIISGLLGLGHTPSASLSDENTAQRPEAKRARAQIREWIAAAGVARTLKNSRFGFIGNTYSGMLDLYSDFTMIQAQTGIHIEILEMCDLDRNLRTVTDTEVVRKLDEIKSMFAISGDSPSDPLVKKPSEEQLFWSARVSVAQDKLVAEYELDALAYYYHSFDGHPYEELQGGFIVGHSLLTANGVPCAGEGDMKTALAMKICDTLGLGGSFCEIAATDYEQGTILIGHDGPFHIGISDQKPLLRGMGVYHGKKGTGVSVEAKVKAGPVTTLNVTQSVDGRLKLIAVEAEATDGTIMTIGNTQTHARFGCDPDTFMEKWFAQAPTHHFALSTGHNASLFVKAADILNLEIVVL